MDKKGFKLTDMSVDSLKSVYVMLFMLCVAGVMQYLSTDKEKFPEIEFPYYSITSVYPGASPEDIENLITVPIEKEIKGIDNVKKVITKSMQDVGIMLVQFEVGADGIIIAQDIRDAVDIATQQLPADMPDDPRLKKLDMSQLPMINISLSGDVSPDQLKEHAENLKDIIEGFEEITRVDIVGALDRQIQVNVDYLKLLASGISFGEISNAIAMENMTISGGLIDLKDMKRSMKVTGEFENPKEIEMIQIRDGIYIKDIAEVKDGFEDRVSYARLNGEACVLLDVIRKSGKSLIGATDKVMVALEDYSSKMPKNVKVDITGDQSIDTTNSVNNLFNTVIFGFFVVVIVLMFFMGTKNAFFVGVAIPISIVLAFLTLPMIDFTINMVVLMAF